MRIGLRGSGVPEGVTFAVGRARPMPLDWERWRDALIGVVPEAPVVEEYTVPEGWSVTIVETPATVHAFYAVLDHAVHATATLAPGTSAATIARVRTLFREAAPVWDDEIVALGEL